jgi:hypothetical protein
MTPSSFTTCVSVCQPAAHCLCLYNNFVLSLTRSRAVTIAHQHSLELHAICARYCHLCICLTTHAHTYVLLFISTRPHIHTCKYVTFSGTLTNMLSFHLLAKQSPKQHTHTHSVSSDVRQYPQLASRLHPFTASTLEENSNNMIMR